ncbi:MAG TPA: DUF1835 domain-containing protein [Mucilaginibacter sp.]|nr:DUF1835 domain-containing protein [Mucilaginibacter sp.]
MAILHILNGESTRYGFEETGLSGDVMVWHEIFSQGPLDEDISSAQFWRNREEWITETFGEQPESYRQKMLDELAKLSCPYDEINLWFEFDLHCQANLLGVLAYLDQKTDMSAPAVYLICPGSFPGKPDFMGMGELNGEELTYLYDNIREQLSEEDFALARQAWQVFVSKDAARLANFLQQTTFWGSLHFLKPALQARLSLLQLNVQGLNYVEQKLLDICNAGAVTLPERCKAFWRTEKIFGMGDAEISVYLDNLRNKKLIG